jgi:hypothetical protein
LDTSIRIAERVATQVAAIFGYEAMELAGLEPATSWMRSNGDRSRRFAPVR